MNPFVYPKTLHVRRFTPKQYKRYQTYKHILRLEFLGKCVYCQMPVTMKGSASFGVDHYRPKKLFPALECEYSNLYYCCNSCNSGKGAYWPSKAVEELTNFIPNPCDHRMFEHLRFSGAVVEGKTQAGKVAVELLDLNDPEAVSFREFMVGAAEIFEGNRAELRKKQQAVDQKRKKGKMTQADADAATAEIAAQLSRLEALENRLAGVL